MKPYFRATVVLTQTCSAFWTVTLRAGRVSVGGHVGVCEKKKEIWVKEAIIKNSLLLQT